MRMVLYPNLEEIRLWSKASEERQPTQMFAVPSYTDPQEGRRCMCAPHAQTVTRGSEDTPKSLSVVISPVKAGSFVAVARLSRWSEISCQARAVAEWGVTAGFLIRQSTWQSCALYEHIYLQFKQQRAWHRLNSPWYLAGFSVLWCHSRAELPKASQLDPNHLLQTYSNRSNTTTLLLRLLLGGAGFTVLDSHHLWDAQDSPMPSWDALSHGTLTQKR